jgi:hypothetical protein
MHTEVRPRKRCGSTTTGGGGGGHGRVEAATMAKREEV